MKHLMITGLILALAGCGGHDRFKNTGSSSSVRTKPAAASVPTRARMASGPISNACMASDRKARSRALCGCIQAVADDTLSGAEQRRAVTFYDDPQKAQDIRMSDRARDDAFWDAYVAYAEAAKRTCS